MGFAVIKEKARELFEEAPFVAHIRNDEDYEQALSLMEELIEDYDNQKSLIDVLCVSVAQRHHLWRRSLHGANYRWILHVRGVGGGPPKTRLTGATRRYLFPIRFPFCCNPTCLDFLWPFFCADVDSQAV